MYPWECMYASLETSDIEIEKESQNLPLRNVAFQMENPAFLTITNSNGKILVSDKLHHHSDYMLIWQKSQAAYLLGHNDIQSHMLPSD